MNIKNVAKVSLVASSIIFSLFLFSTSAISSPVNFSDSGDYLTDATSGLDWLDITKTANMSFNAVRAELGHNGMFEGWRYATGDELNTLVSDYTGITIPAGNYGQVFLTKSLLIGLIESLGNLSPDAIRHYSYGMLADASEAYYFTVRWAAMIEIVDTPLFTEGDFSQAHRTDIWEYAYGANFGSFLVRATLPVVESIPEPGSIALLGLALVGLTACRRKRINPSN